MIVKKIKRQKEQRSVLLNEDLNLDCPLNNEIILKLQQRFKSVKHDVYTEEVNKIALSSNDDKRLQTFDRITSYPYGTSAGKV